MKIITEQPVQVTALRKSVPPHVAAMRWRRRLEKLPADRFETAAKFAHALNDPGFATRAGSVAFAAGAGGVPARWRATALALGGIAALALGAALWLGLGARDTSHLLGVPVQFDVQLPEGVELSQAGTAIHAAVSPDGNTVAFLGSDGTMRRIYLRQLGDSEVRPVAGTESASLMFFSPDGQSLGFVASGRLSRVGLADGIITTISVLSGVGLGGAAWGANNVIVFSTGGSSALWQVPATGGEATAFLAPDTARGDVGFALPHFLPDGKSLVFSINRGRGVFPIAVGTLEGELTELGVAGLRAQYVAASGHLLFSDGGGRLLGVRFDPDRKRILGAPAMLLEGVQENLASIGVWAASPTGTVVVDRGTTQSRLALVDREGTAQPLSDDARSFRLPRVSPDGQRILVQVTAPSQEGLWLHDRRTGTLTRFTPPGRYSDGIWSRDGTRIAFSGDGADQSVDIFWQSADGSGSPVPLLQAPGNQWPWTWTPDGRTLLYDEIVANRATRVMAVTIDSAAPRPSAVLESAAHLFRTPTLSPDGRWLAYTSNESGRIEVYVRPYPASGGKQQVSLSGGDQPVWSRDGSELFYRDDRNLISASLRFDGAVSVTARTSLFEDRFERSNATNYDALPNGRGFVMLEPQSGTRRLSVLVNWGSQLRARVGGEEQ
jgi:eukaryotic-like serine/threonine-protein kinase